MAQYRYCLHQDILSVQTPDRDHRECVYVPAGTIVSINGLHEDQKFVEVDWNSKTVLMFRQDIKDRAEPLFT